MPLSWSEIRISCQFHLLLFKRLNYQAGKNVAGVLAPVDVLGTRVPSLRPGAGFFPYEIPELGLGEILPLHPPQEVQGRGLGEESWQYSWNP